jgi:tetratricopeptide (TPR) repeat protein
MDYEDYGEATQELIDKFERMMDDRRALFFDVHEFESMVDHYLMKGQLKKALKTTIIGMEQHPMNASLPIKRAQVLTAFNRPEEALQILDKAESLEPNSSELLIARGLIFSRQGLHDKALKLFQQALEKGTNPEEDILVLIANELQAGGQYEKAIEYYREVLRLDPQDDISLYNIAFCFEILDQYDEAVQFFESQIETEPYSELSWYHLALAQHGRMEYREALRAIDYAILIDEHFDAAYHEKGNILEDMGDFGRAIDVYQELLEMDTFHASVYLRISMSYKQLGNLKAALIYAIKATHEEDNFEEAWMERGLILRDLGKLQEGIHFIKKAVKMQPKNADFQFMAAISYLDMEFYEESALHFSTAAELGLQTPLLWKNFALLRIQQQDYEEARVLLMHGLKEFPDEAELLLFLSAANWYSLRKEDALEDLAKALTLDPYLEPEFQKYFGPLLEEQEIQNRFRTYGKSHQGDQS